MVVGILAEVHRVQHPVVVVAAVRIRSLLQETTTAMDTVSAAVRHRIVHQEIVVSPKATIEAHLAEATIITAVTNPAAEAAVIVPAIPVVTNPAAEAIMAAEAVAIVPEIPAVTNPAVETIPVAEVVIVPAILADILVVETIPVAEVATVLAAPDMVLVEVLADILVAVIVPAVLDMVPVTVPDVLATRLLARCVPTTRTTITTRARLGRITIIRLISSCTTSSEWL